MTKSAHAAGDFPAAKEGSAISTAPAAVIHTVDLSKV
jgi:hypothetical protein